MPNQAWWSRVRSRASVRSGSLVIAAVSGSTPGMLQRAHGLGVRSVSPLADGERAPVVLGPRGRAGDDDVGAEAAHVDVAAGVVAERLERRAVDHEQRKAVGEADDVAGARVLGVDGAARVVGHADELQRRCRARARTSRCRRRGARRAHAIAPDLDVDARTVGVHERQQERRLALRACTT